MEFESVDSGTKTWKQILAMLESGEISMLTQLLFSTERDGKFLWSDTPYVSSRYALLSKENVPYLAAFQVADTVVGTLDNTVYESNYRIWFPDNKNTVGFASRIEGLNALERGEINLLMASEFILPAQTNYREKSGYKVNILFDGKRVPRGY